MAWKHIFKRVSAQEFSCHAIKVSHHGSLDGNFPDKSTALCKLFSKCENRVAIISGGYRTDLPHPDVVSAFKNSTPHLYCTGRLETTQPRPYTPQAALQDREIMALLGVEEICEVADTMKSGHGDVVLECFENGTCKATPQFRI
jgi:hypothetical protein